MYNLIIATKVQTSCQNMIILFHVYVTQFADCTKLAIKRPCQSQFFSNFAVTKHPFTMKIPQDIIKESHSRCRIYSLSGATSWTGR